LQSNLIAILFKKKCGKTVNQILEVNYGTAVAPSLKVMYNYFICDYYGKTAYF
jgi:hypothetical protein